MLDLNTLTLPVLFAELDRDGHIAACIDAAWREDVDDAGDVTTSSLVSVDVRGLAQFIARQEGIVAGLAVVERLAALAGVDFEPAVGEGTRVERSCVIGTVTGNLAGLLRAERPMLNFISRLSGIATLTRAYVDATAGSRAVICDTRKTTPGLRHVEKYAVRCGGGTLHRLNLSDAMLVKDNHLAAVAADRLGPALQDAIVAARAQHDLRFVEVEVDTLEQLDVVLALPSGLVDVIMLDNMKPDALRDAVRRRDDAAPQVQLEASGGVTLQTVAAIAATGVDRISVGALTHSAVALDVGLDIEA